MYRVSWTVPGDRNVHYEDVDTIDQAEALVAILEADDAVDDSIFVEDRFIREWQNDVIHRPA